VGVEGYVAQQVAAIAAIAEVEVAAAATVAAAVGTAAATEVNADADVDDVGDGSAHVVAEENDPVGLYGSRGSLDVKTHAVAAENGPVGPLGPYGSRGSVWVAEETAVPEGGSGRGLTLEAGTCHT